MQVAVRLHRRKGARRPAPKLKRPDGAMSVREAGRLGGLKGGRKGGLAVKAERGVEFFQEIGRLGGRAGPIRQGAADGDGQRRRACEAGTGG